MSVMNDIGYRMMDAICNTLIHEIRMGMTAADIKKKYPMWDSTMIDTLYNAYWFEESVVTE